MKEYDLTEQAYKNGYAKGKADAVKEMKQKIEELEKAHTMLIKYIISLEKKLLEKGETK